MCRVPGRIERSLSVDLAALLPAVAERLAAAGRPDQLHQLLQQLLETTELSQGTLRRLVALPPAGHPCVSLLLAAITEPAVRVSLQTATSLFIAPSVDIM